MIGSPRRSAAATNSSAYRTPSDAAGALKTGENVIAVRADHGSITELFLGGIIRPVLLTGDEG